MSKSQLKIVAGRTELDVQHETVPDAPDMTKALTGKPTSTTPTDAGTKLSSNAMDAWGASRTNAVSGKPGPNTGGVAPKANTSKGAQPTAPAAPLLKDLFTKEK